VERLSGEHVTDTDTDTASARQADLWVATTEKFEAICRAGSLRDTLAAVDVLVVDEIHLLGDPVRGPMLEALLSRMRGTDSPVRIVGLSATAANADQVAQWLGGRLVTTTWRPSSLTWQLPMVSANEDRRSREAHRTRVATAITQQATQDSGSVLVFCGNKRGVRATALAIAKARGADVRGIDPDDLSRVHQICKTRRIGLHYKDWEHKREAERAFRARELDVLVATSTLAAGVNLPARTTPSKPVPTGGRSGS
jgi:helicase